MPAENTKKKFKKQKILKTRELAPPQFSLIFGRIDRATQHVFKNGMKYVPLYLSIVPHMSRSRFLSLSTDVATASVGAGQGSSK
ncbi:predicted protein [Sclerotinia sclerotiorum 1980 UF-70]|uniref:Uncharacterized protein n=1 Tax=Sclerotinia sclerotiorum (strain ATCC 18683 / 1980 / Ss-1) TaxID=665079 RepID=A7F8X4_SCLS1|nr:predicted protein [Sclerotinia sclerotiorum 1980 UF-70]EDN99195.1 predicted protein [Sclerotinia sclerotiorum 1980 UF-70]